jgi:acetyltransferase-like isoleucine patch superfamily enzyme/glycosyltransferase involved in cell wall biosynthesis
MPGFKFEGKNVKIYDTAKIICPENISIGDEAIIADFSFIYAVGKGIEIGNFCHITEHAILQAGGLLKIGDFSAIGPRTTILAATDDYKGNGLIGHYIFNEGYRNLSNKDVIIGKHVHIGMGCIIMPGVTIGDGCSIGAGSLVTKDMPAWTICYGSPCKPIREKPKEKILALEKKFLLEYEKNKKDRPLVSIACLTYNHEKLISKAIEGFLMQKTNFEYEIVIHDDASTDNTQKVILEYQKKYPKKIKTIFQTENQYRKTGKYPINILYNELKGEYVAECDGDDYWTDPLKLQKQVDFLEKNPDYVMCHHAYNIQNDKDLIINQRDIPRDYTREELIGYSLGGYGIGHCTKMWRNIYQENKKDFEECIGDYALNVLMGLHGECKFIECINPSIYRRMHGNNSWCNLPAKEMEEKTKELFQKLYQFIMKKENPHWSEIRRSFTVPIKVKAETPPGINNVAPAKQKYEKPLNGLKKCFSGRR